MSYWNKVNKKLNLLQQRNTFVCKCIFETFSLFLLEIFVNLLKDPRTVQAHADDLENDNFPQTFAQHFHIKQLMLRRHWHAYQPIKIL